MFKPFADEQSFHAIHDLNLENQFDCINVYGNLQITKDQAGLQAAKALQAFLNDVVQQLEQERDLPEKLDRPDADEVENPFL